MSKRWIFAAIPLLLAAIAMVGAPRLGVHAEEIPVRGLLFLLMLSLLGAEFAVLGSLINGRWIGAFIDDRNRLSLSKLQAGAWTVVVLSAIATAAAFNAASGAANPMAVAALNVQIPGELLLAMGISATSLAATPSLLSLKADNPTPSDGAVTQAAKKLGVSSVSPNGTLFSKSSVSDASWGDLFTGEEIGNAGYPDIGKIQQIIITLLLLGCYAGYAFKDFSGNMATITSLPLLDKSFVWLMGISHASYLAYKAAPHTKT